MFGEVLHLAHGVRRTRTSGIDFPPLSDVKREHPSLTSAVLNPSDPQLDTNTSRPSQPRLITIRKHEHTHTAVKPVCMYVRRHLPFNSRCSSILLPLLRNNRAQVCSFFHPSCYTLLRSTPPPWGGNRRLAIPMIGSHPYLVVFGWRGRGSGTIHETPGFPLQQIANCQRGFGGIVGHHA